MTTFDRKLFYNIASGAAIQSLEYLFPLLIMPLMLRSIGSEAYGQYIFYQAIFAYGVLLVEYAFTHSTAKLVAGSLHAEKVSGIYSTALFMRLIAAFLFVSLFVSSLYFVGNGGDRILLTLATSVSVFGAALYPSWFLQATENIRLGMLFNLVSRLLILSLLFVFVKSPEDVVLAALLLSSTNFLAGIGVNGYFFSTKKIHLQKMDFKLAINIIRNGFPVFKAILSSSFYRSINPVILGLLCAPSILAWYSVIEKIIKASQELLRPISQACYPKILIIAGKSKKDAMEFIFKILIFSFFFGLLISGLLIFNSKLILSFLSGNRSEWTEHTLFLMRLMAVIPVIGIINSVIGIQTYIPFGLDKLFSSAVLSVSVFSLLIIWPAVYFFEDIGAAIVYLGSEVVLLYLLLLGLKRNGFLMFGRMR